jgi:hypothetical protein
MPALSTEPYGKVVKESRQRLRISPDHFATITNVDASYILKLEAEDAPHPESAFYQHVLRFLQKTGVIDLFVRSVLEAAKAGNSTSDLEKHIYPLIEPLIGQPELAEILRRAITAPDIHTKSLQTGASIRDKEAPNGLKEHPLPIHYPHSMPEHGARVVDEGKWEQAPKKGVVYKRPRSHYDSKYLQQNADSVVGMISTALKNNDPALSTESKQALHLIAESVAKSKGTSLSKTSREHNIPLKTLSDYVAKNLVPVLYRDKNTIYLASETAEEVSRDYQEAKEAGIHPARLLRERREKYFPQAS